MNDRHPLRTGAALLLLTALSVVPAAAEDDKLGWSDVAEFSYVMTDGNSESSTLGFKNTAVRTWENASYELRLGGVRAESTTTARFATLLPGGQVAVSEVSTTETTAEQYFVRNKYSKDITERFFWYTGLDWDRNRPAGIQNRYIAQGGVGNVWYDTDKIKFKTDYAVTYTDEEQVDVDPMRDDTYAGVRFSWTYAHKFGENTTYGNDFIVDGNADETDDYRADMTNWLAVSMNKRMALKVSYQLLYDNLPSLESIPQFDLTGAQLQNFLVARDDLDSIFSVSLVVNF